MDKESLLQKIVEYYLKSTEYNGLPIYSLADNSDDILCQLVDEDKIEILSSNDVINPHIKAFDVTTNKDTQKEYIHNKAILSVAYPSKSVLRSIDIDLTMPYSGMLRKGAEQFEILYFDIEILERYANNPKFFIIDNGYDFVLVIEKMLVHNISFKTFVVDGINVKGISRQDDNGNSKGSLQMLEEWLCINTTAKAEDIQKVIISPLKKIRKIRQLPAHELASNEYNKRYYTDQFNLVDDAYCSLASIRNLLHSNPAVRYVKIPDYLIDGTLIVNY